MAGRSLCWTPVHWDGDGCPAFSINLGPGYKIWFFISQEGIAELLTTHGEKSVERLTSHIIQTLT